jgi:uncharacterized protein YceK
MMRQGPCRPPRTFLKFVLAGFCLTVFASGCGTVITRTVGPNWAPPDPPLSRVYSGVLFDLKCFWRPEAYETENISGFCVFDLPLSLVADTVILPLTIYEQVKYGSYSAPRPDGQDARTP